MTPRNEIDPLELELALKTLVNTQYAVNGENRTTSPGSWMQYIMCSRNCSKSSRSVLGRQQSQNTGGTTRFLQRFFTAVGVCIERLCAKLHTVTEIEVKMSTIMRSNQGFQGYVESGLLK